MGQAADSPKDKDGLHGPGRRRSIDKNSPIACQKGRNANEMSGVCHSGSAHAKSDRLSEKCPTTNYICLYLFAIFTEFRAFPNRATGPSRPVVVGDGVNRGVTAAAQTRAEKKGRPGTWIGAAASRVEWISPRFKLPTGPRDDTDNSQSPYHLLTRLHRRPMRRRRGLARAYAEVQQPPRWEPPAIVGLKFGPFEKCPVVNEP